MKDYLLVSTGKAGSFQFQHDKPQDAIDASKAELAKGQSCELFRKYATLEAGEVVVKKTGLEEEPTT